MKTAQEIQQELLKLLPESKELVIKAIKKYFPRGSNPYREAVLLDGRLKALRKKEFQGTMDMEDVQTEENKIRVALMDIITAVGEMENIEEPSPNRKLLFWGILILLFAAGIFVGMKYFSDGDSIEVRENLPDSLTTDFLGDTLQRKIVGDNSDGKSPVGKILYSVPSKMRLMMPVRCLIRIAPEDLSTLKLVEGIPTDAAIEIDSVRIGEVMTAKIANAPSDESFTISNLSTSEQVIEDGFATEWLFNVLPLKPGIHSLYIKVTVKVLIEGFGEKSRDIFVMDKKIEIVTEEVPTGDPVLEDGGRVILASLNMSDEELANVRKQVQKNASDEAIRLENEMKKTESEAFKKTQAARQKQAEEEIKRAKESLEKVKNGTFGTESGSGKGNTKTDPVILSKAVSPKIEIGGAVKGRAVIRTPKTDFKVQKTGKVALQICVDKTGKVTASKYVMKGSTTTDLELRNAAIRDSKKWVFAKSDTNMQCGTMIYDFRGR